MPNEAFPRQPLGQDLQLRALAQIADNALRSPIPEPRHPAAGLPADDQVGQSTGSSQAGGTFSATREYAPETLRSFIRAKFGDRYAQDEPAVNWPSRGNWGYWDSQFEVQPLSRCEVG